MRTSPSMQSRTLLTTNVLGRAGDSCSHFYDRKSRGQGQEKSHVRNWSSKGHFAPLMRPAKFPEIPVSLERNTEVFRHPLPNSCSSPKFRMYVH